MQLIDYLPLVYQRISEYEAIADAEQTEVSQLELEMGITLRNQFIAGLSEYGCARWEEMLGITPLATSSVEDRRFVILSKYRESLPYTWKSLIGRLNTTLGEGNYLLTEDRENWTLTLKLLLTRKAQLTEVSDMLESILPCELIYEVKLLYNSHNVLHAFTHEYLSAYTHTELKEEVLS